MVALLLKRGPICYSLFRITQFTQYSYIVDNNLDKYKIEIQPTNLLIYSTQATKRWIAVIKMT